jgi:pilus assembly protein Flp/PilA
MLKIYTAAQTQLQNLKDRVTRLQKDEDGAALIEYSILIGLITVAAIAAIIFVGSWVATQWTNLQSALTAA